ncbi:hypothetical protein LOZ61_004723 [Ophidiomyces ophidiicola]|uniref:Uncharacterized protein n=1 Tax=Ophidiomyces ophidiicola TaxID=1387563 RepID=A0ACB8UYM4_9EURO|nr:uncharacterized protein LOZ57_006467 [Ophidiomyces ophidiicola]KAI1909886.1 hypothetical protein LOZ61_004723 [Ophidiomyces ophidiicola]KAI1924084.1 hypothetical protein LOZ64_000826 [Ophidiomyces ophidiicola]KAI1925040.1 hypothetical protein LOZ60_004319 [Ophidiomyces ophidiicola]KAI1937918.1 hypothetical protein LOZ57_006467 [Ophidiomyces ophidiicola]KAI2010663.1 hypothetical protein LOZ49_003400 [Ophidiomyces ophidiicola]
MSTTEAVGQSTTFKCGRQGNPDLRLLHYNDVYHVDTGSADPVGGTPRFQTLVNYYRNDARFAGLPAILTFFSGDAFNPSLESTVTKGRHMVPFLNHAGTDVACVGNHDLDFGIAQFRHLRSQCKFPWLLANVLDPALGENVSLAGCEKTCILTSSNGIKVGVIGLGEREWLATINSLPPNIIYKSASETAKELVPKLREQGAELIIAITHQREPNDNKLANNTPPGLIDIILGGHDHYYMHSIQNGVHVLRSGTDFKQLSYIEAWRKKGQPGWDFNITRRDVVRYIQEDVSTLQLVAKLTSSLKSKLQKPIGYTATPLDGRFCTVRTSESNLGNFVCDLMRFYHGADCSIMAAGTIRGDQIYPPGVLRVKDILNCFPFEDPVVVLRVNGLQLRAALENGVSQLPALEGRFPQVSNIQFAFSTSRPSGARVLWVKIGNDYIEDGKMYTLSTRGYMARGKDGFSSLLVKSEGGDVEEIVSEEDGLLLSTILRQYFLSLKVLGKWHRFSRSLHRHWDTVNNKMRYDGLTKSSQKAGSVKARLATDQAPSPCPSLHYIALRQTAKTPAEVPTCGADDSEGSLMDSESDSEADILSRPRTYITKPAISQDDADHREYLARQVLRKWRQKIGLDDKKVHTVGEAPNDSLPPWTRVISPKIEGRIIQVDDKEVIKP